MNKGASRELWDPAPYTKGPNRILPTCASANRQTDLLAVKSAVACEKVPATLGYRTWRTLTWAVSHRAFVEVQVSGGEVLALHWSKKIEI